MAKVTILGNFSGRNAGDNAILGCVLDELSSRYGGLEFLIPTLNPAYIRRAFGEYRIEPLGLMPWNGAIKIFGMPTLRAMLGADLVLVTDAILFDRWYFNPLHNYLATIGLFAPICKRAGIPVVLYNAHLGPIGSERGLKALQRILDAGPITILRDRQSMDFLASRDLHAADVRLGADSALGTRAPEPQHVDRLLDRLGLEGHERPLFGFNINSYVDSWQSAGDARLSRTQFTTLMAEALDTLISSLDVQPVCFVTQVMDRGIANEVISRMRHGPSVRVVANPDYDYREIVGIMSRLGLLFGMRTHSLILASAAGTPVVNLNVYPKSQAFLRTIGMEQWSIDFQSLSVPLLVERVTEAWNVREQIREALAPAVERERRLSKASAALLAPLLGTPREIEAGTPPIELGKPRPAAGLGDAAWQPEIRSSATHISIAKRSPGGLDVWTHSSRR